MNNPFYYTPDKRCIAAAKAVMDDIKSRPGEWQDEVMQGKMFGVMIYEGGEAKAYSGQILCRSDWEGYVPAVFDYLQEDGYFKQEESNIVNINKEISDLENSIELSGARAELEETTRKGNDEIAAYRQFMSESKAKPMQADEYIAMRQFQKAELRRMKGRVASQIAEAQQRVEAYTAKIGSLKTERKRRSDALQQWLFSHFQMLNANGEQRDLLGIFTEWSDKTGSKCVIPPAGSGECCTPKLLQYAFLHGLKPLAIAEFWVGESPKGEVRKAGNYYGACQSKCAPILNFMLRGVDVEDNPLETQEFLHELPVIFEDETMIVVDKPAGMLSVPGKSSRRSAYDVLREMRPDCEQLMMAHRLDMQTSGILIAAKNVETYRELQKSFIGHATIQKTYYALLDGISPLEIGAKGTISLPLSADYLNRPRQKVDFEHGKEAVTEYEILSKGSVEVDGNTRQCTAVRLHPLTGRTHQLRFHCAHGKGLGLPILGDDLYGNHADRLYLHAATLKYGKLTFGSPIPFSLDLHQK